MIENVNIVNVYLKEQLTEEELINKGFSKLENRNTYVSIYDNINISYTLQMRKLPRIILSIDSDEIEIKNLPELNLQDAVKLLSKLELFDFEEITLYGVGNIEDYLSKIGLKRIEFDEQMASSDIGVIYCNRGESWDMSISHDSDLLDKIIPIDK